MNTNCRFKILFFLSSRDFFLSNNCVLTGIQIFTLMHHLRLHLQKSRLIWLHSNSKLILTFFSLVPLLNLLVLSTITWPWDFSRFRYESELAQAAAEPLPDDDDDVFWWNCLCSSRYSARCWKVSCVFLPWCLVLSDDFSSLISLGVEIIDTVLEMDIHTRVLIYPCFIVLARRFKIRWKLKELS